MKQIFDYHNAWDGFIDHHDPGLIEKIMDKEDIWVVYEFREHLKTYLDGVKEVINTTVFDFDKHEINKIRNFLTRIVGKIERLDKQALINEITNDFSKVKKLYQEQKIPILKNEKFKNYQVANNNGLP